MEDLYDSYWEMHNSKIELGHSPLEIAAVIMAQALSLYRTMLSEADFEELLETILARRAQVKPLSRVTIQ
jgi:hypothetical protein